MKKRWKPSAKAILERSRLRGDCEAIESGNDDDASLDRGTTANGHRQPPNAFALLGETKEDGGKIKSKLPRTDPFMTQQSMKLGNYFLAQMRNLKLQRTNVRGSGLMLGIEFLKSDGTPDTARCLGLVKSLLKAGFIVLPEGEHANVLSFTPPLTITKSEIDTTIEALRLLDGDAAGPNGTTGKEGCS